MTDRKKKGIGFFITGAIFALFGGVFMATEVDPTWLGFVPVFVGVIASYFGFQVVFPDNE